MFDPFTRPAEQEDLIHRVIFKILLWGGGAIGLLLAVAYTIPIVLIEDDLDAQADAAVVLFGPQYDSRVFAAGELYRNGRVKQVIINGDRRTAHVDKTLGQSIPPYASWDARYQAILAAQGVPTSAIHSFAIHHAYDTRTEARELAPRIEGLGLRSLVVVTDQYHTGRAIQIWRSLAGTRYELLSHGAKQAGDNPSRWWLRPSEIKRVLVELGGYVFALVT